MKRALVMQVALACIAQAADAQTLAERVATVRDGSVLFHYAVRAGVCGDGSQTIRIGNSYYGSWSRGSRIADCVEGPVQVRITKSDGTVDRVETWVGALRTREGRDLGAVSAPQAAAYLVALAQNAEAGAKAIFPAVLADSARTWPSLLTIARDERRTRSTRQEASFWLSRFAAASAAGHPDDITNDDDRTDKDELKTHAIFVVSQLPRNEGVPLLLDAARTNGNQHVRSAALFWLGQSGDSRALDLFESLMRK